MTLPLAKSEAGGGFGWTSAPQEPIVVVRCPPRKTYSETYLKQAGTELSGLVKQNQRNAAELVNDYRGLRRACDAIERK